MNKTRRYPINISKSFISSLTKGSTSKNLYNKKIIKLKKDKEMKVSWDFATLSQEILSKIPKQLYGWYHESTSSCGNSTLRAVQAYSQVNIIPNYLNPNKSINLNKQVTLYSKELGISTFSCKCPFFTAPYGCASEYGGKSNEIATMTGTIKAGGIYTFSSLSKYKVEDLMHQLKIEDGFFMYQIYITSDKDINISLIERAKHAGASIIMLTIDTGSNLHGGIGIIENKSDLTFDRNFCGNILADPVFNIKCYREKKCVGTKDLATLRAVSKVLNISVPTLLASYKSSAFDYAKIIQGGGMNISSDNIREIATICHSFTSLGIIKLPVKGVPLVIKGCLSIENALQIQKSNADGVYVSNHGGRFVYNSLAPLNVIRDIRESVKKVNKNFGVWMDGGIRNGQDIFTAYTMGAEFVGVGRPIIYAGVLYGEAGVSSITKKLIIELESQCILCGQNDLNNYDKLKKNIKY